jgi:hypothetical protein
MRSLPFGFTEMSTFALVALMVWLPGSARAADQSGRFVVWERVAGIAPVANINAQTVNGYYLPVSFPWTVTKGQAQVDLVSGRYRFSIKGLSIGAMPPSSVPGISLSPIGTTGVVRSVTGTFICANEGPGIDTGIAVLSLSGDASLQGFLPYEFDCDPEAMIFLLRVAEVIPGAPTIEGLWLAHGAAKRLQGRAP